MIEVLKQIVEALEWCHGGEPVGTADAIKAGKQLIAELESQESQIKTTDSFESAKVKDYNRGWNDCFFASGIVKQSQRTWVGLTDYEIGVCSTEAAMNRSGMVGGAVTFARAIEAKLKDKNCAG